MACWSSDRPHLRKLDCPAALVDTERHLLTRHRYIELNPVRAHMIEDNVDYPWSNYRHSALDNTIRRSPHMSNTPNWHRHQLRGKSRIAPWSARHGRQSPRRSPNAHSATACLGQRTLPAANRSPDPVRGQCQAVQKTIEITSSRD